MKDSKKKPKKHKHRNFVIFGRGNLGSRRWKVDYDYINELSQEEKNFLNDFTEEYYLANIKKDMETGKYKGRFLKTKEERRKTWYENSVSNRCIMSLNNTNGKVKTQVVNYDSQNNDKVNNLVDLIHSNKNEESSAIAQLDFKAQLKDEKFVRRLTKALKKPQDR